MSRMTTGRHKVFTWLIPIALLLISLFVYTRYGFSGRLGFDEGLSAYGAGQLTQGVPPYVSVFVIKGPMSMFVLASAILLGDVAGIDQVLSMRIAGLIASCLSALFIYFLGVELFRGKRAGVLIALTFLTFYTFGRYASSGPRAKTFMVTFLILALWLAARRKWFLAGFAGALAALVWQPTAVLPALTFFAAMLQGDVNGGRRIRSGLAVAAGVALPLGATTAYFAATGTLREAIDATVLFNVKYLDRGAASLLDHIFGPMRLSVLGYPGQWLIILVGSLMILELVFRRVGRAGGIRPFIAGDRFAVLLLSFPLFVLWSLIDFGSPTDLFVLLPYFSIGFGWFLHQGVDAVTAVATPAPWQRAVFECLLCLAMIVAAGYPLEIAEPDVLSEQRQAVREIESLLGDDGVLLTLHAPEVLVLMGRANLTRYLYLVGGADRYVDDYEEDGFDGWMSRLEHLEPRVVVLGTSKVLRQGVPPAYRAWLAEKYEKQRVWHWDVYVRE